MQTWAANLWITNDEGMYLTAREVIAEAIDDAGENVGPFTGANALESWFDTQMTWLGDTDTEVITGMLRDIGSLWRVNWREIAEGLMED